MREKDQLKSNVSKFKMQLPCVVGNYINGYDVPLSKRYVKSIEKLINDIGIKCEMLYLITTSSVNRDEFDDVINIELALPKRSQNVFDKLIKDKHSQLRDIILNEPLDLLISNDINDWLDSDSKFYIYSNPIQLRYMFELLIEIILEDDYINEKYYGSIEKYLESNF